ncbi:hypothetical protein ACI784_18220 [Geodermatophilus sp. SYSU D01186]
MSDPVHRSTERTRGYVEMSPAEKLMCEWEARHDVAARGGRVDPTAALLHHLSHTRREELEHHHEHPERRARQRKASEEFAAEHPFTASWVRWGEDRR